MSKRIDVKKYGMNISFSVDESGRLLILGISDKIEDFEENNEFNALEIHITGSNPDDHGGAKHTGESMPYVLRYAGHEENENSVVFTLENEIVRVMLYYVFYENTKVVRSYSVIENISNSNVGIDYISSLCLYGFDAEHIMIPHNSWCRENNWREYEPCDLGFSPINRFSTKRISVHNTGTWSCKEYLPMGSIKSKDKTYFWQIENNGSWQWEISDIDGCMYLKLSGPNEQENGWWKDLRPKESFETVKSAIAVVSGNFDDAVFEMTKYRRNIAYRSPADKKLPVIFNDYMGCLNADPTTEKEIPVIDAAARAGAEIYCMDAGWYADGTWWETVGEWKVFEKRFPNGMKEVFDYIRSKGMIPGIWLEPEVMGINCPILDRFDDTCFFVRHGKRVIYHGRYQLDLRNRQVTEFLDSVVDGLIEDYGIGYFKFDYNIDAGLGTELFADSFGDGLLQHNDAFLKWIDGIYKRHPDIIIESCASGGMRMDYKTLSHCSLQSVSDAEDYMSTAVIASMANISVLPEQSAVWCIPKKTDSAEVAAYNMVNAMFKRIHLSGETHLLSGELFDVVKEGVDFYKSVRDKIPGMRPFYPLGIINFESGWTGCGYEDTETKIKYLCIGRLNGEDTVYIPAGKVKSAEIVYPKKSSANVNIIDEQISVSLTKNSAVVIKTTTTE